MNENSQYVERINRLNHENMLLSDKWVLEKKTLLFNKQKSKGELNLILIRIKELEDGINEAERKTKLHIDSEIARYQEALNKQNLSFSDEKDSFLIQWVNIFII
jgi:hypothetical protein